jgi:hypothetical protein
MRRPKQWASDFDCRLVFRSIRENTHPIVWGRLRAPNAESCLDRLPFMWDSRCRAHFLSTFERGA